MTVIPFPWRLELSSAAPPAIATDALAELIFSMILDREAELAALAEAEAEAEAGFPMQDELEACSSAASIDPFTKRSNAALASAMIWRDRAAA